MVLRTSLKLCLITQAANTQPVEFANFIQQVIAGGVTMVQLRDKSNNLMQIYQTACNLKSLLQPCNIPFIINDNVELAKQIDADGVHLGQSDMTPEIARALLGPNKIIGWSVESFGDLEQANASNVIDYIAASAVFPSISKTNCKTIWGLTGLQNVSRQSRYPVIAIGGITTANVQQVIAHGACGVAVISAIHQHPEPHNASKQFISLINTTLEDNINVRTN